MIAPEGYVLVSELMRRVFEDDYDAEWENYCRDWFDIPWKFVHLRPDDILERWLKDFVLPDLRVFSSKHGLLRVDGEKLMWPRWDMDFALTDMKSGRLGTFEIPADLVRRFDLAEPIDCDDVYGLSDRERGKLNVPWEVGLDGEMNERIRSFLDTMQETVGLSRPYMFIEMKHYSLDLSLYQFLFNHLTGKGRDNYICGEEEHTAFLLKPYEGGALCVSEGYVSKNWDSFWKGKGSQSGQVGEPNKSDKLQNVFFQSNLVRRRLSKPEIAANVLNSLPPKELASLTYKEKAAAIFEHSGVHVSKTSILRAEGRRVP